MTETYQEALARLTKKVEEAQEMFARHRQTEEANRRYAEERQRRQDAMTLLEYAVPDFAAPLRRLREEHDQEVARLRNNPDLTDEAKDRWIAEVSEKHRREVAEEVEVVRDRMGSYLSRYRAIARVTDEPEDEVRYARKEREFMAKVQAGRRPDLESYWEAIESGDRDLVRVFEVHGALYIEDHGKRNEFTAEVERQKQARLTDEQKLARQRVRELQAKQNDIEMGLRAGAFGREVRDA